MLPAASCVDVGVSCPLSVTLKTSSVDFERHKPHQSSSGVEQYVEGNLLYIEGTGPSSSTSPSSVADNTNEESGSKTVVKSKQGLQLKCPHANCTHARTFPRLYELKRHIRVKHGGQKPFSCPFKGCFKGATAPSYARSDKLTSHIRNVHGKHMEKLLDCCFDDCMSPPLTLDLLGLHIRHAHAKPNPFGEAVYCDEKARALVNAASTKYRQCPLWRCAKPLRLPNFIQHLSEHSTEDLEDAIAELNMEGYVISNKSHVRCNPELSDNEMVQASARSVVRIRVRCPMCNDTFETLQSLQMHIVDEHLIAESQKEHYSAWKEYFRKFSDRVKILGPWGDWELVARIHHLTCPFCERPQIGAYSTDHHVSMLADTDEVKLHRRAILKLYPDFSTHPVWKDLD